MSTHPARDDWADARTDEALRRELDTLAGHGASASGLDAALGTVRRRVRRRRAAKQIGLGATTLAVAGGLVVGGAALMPEDPLLLPPPPAGTPSETVAPSFEPSQPPAPDTSNGPDGADDSSGAALEIIEEGYRPSWLEGTDLVCGMPVDDLDAGAAGFALQVTGSLTQEVLGDQEVPVWRLPTRIAIPDGAPSGSLLIGPTLIWTQDGRVVDVGTDMTEDPQEVPAGGTVTDAVAEDWLHTTCAPDRSAELTEFPTDLPAGDYQVYAFYDLWNPSGTADLILSEPVEVTLP